VGEYTLGSDEFSGFIRLSWLLSCRRKLMRLCGVCVWRSPPLLRGIC
jgi:hypothetical protein